MKQIFSLHKMCELYHVCCFIRQSRADEKEGFLAACNRIRLGENISLQAKLSFPVLFIMNSLR